MARKPIIGITTEVQDADGQKVTSGRYYASIAYNYSVEAAGGVPLMLPASDNPDVVIAHALAIDGLLLSGGVDVNPLLYGEQPVRELGAVSDERDRYELMLIHEVAKRGKPIFGICRGIQMLNLAFGGTLWQDIYLGSDIIKHRQDQAGFCASHSVIVASGTLLESMVSSSVLTNSFHHQACKAVAPGFVVSARSSDGIVEGIEAADGRMLYAVQWHPEHMTRHHPAMLNLFRQLVAAAFSCAKEV